MTCSPEELAQIADGLWVNAQDSLRHALDHFTEREQSRAERQQRDKWIILSVHQAAECICNMRLLELAPESLFRANGTPWFPSLPVALGELMKPDHETTVGAAERRLFILMSELSGIRNQLMHRTAPEQIDV